jgi:hypothetical protein
LRLLRVARRKEIIARDLQNFFSAVGSKVLWPENGISDGIARKRRHIESTISGAKTGAFLRRLDQKFTFREEN